MNNPTLQPHSVFIDDIEYQFHHISVKKLNRLLIKIIKVVGEPLANSVDPSVAAIAQTDQEKAKESVDLVKVVKALSQSLDEDTVDQIIDGLLAGTICVGKGAVSQHFEKIFGHSLSHLWKVIFAAAKHYFGDFFQEGLGLIKQ